MKVIKRLYLSVFGTLDALAERLQNHDALVQASLQELDVKLLEARNAHAALNRSLKKTAEDAERFRTDVEAWRRRAREKGIADQREAAIECLRRAQQAEQAIHALERQQQSSEVARRRIEQTIEEMQNMRKSFSLKHRELRAREQEQALISISPFSSVKDAEEVLARWEDSLGGVLQDVPLDDFADGFIREEHRLQLENELEELIRGS